jgi:hypothetical protein
MNSSNISESAGGRGGSQLVAIQYYWTVTVSNLQKYETVLQYRQYE